MSFENKFDSLLNKMGLNRGTADSFQAALDEAAPRNGRVYYTFKGFQTDANRSEKAVKIPIEAIQELAKAIGQGAEEKAPLLRHNFLKRFWIWLTGSPSADQQHQRISQEVLTVLYPEFNKWAQRNVNGRPKFLDVVYREDISDVKQAIDELLTSPRASQKIDQLFFDTNGKNPLHALATNPQLEGTTVSYYMRELKRLDPNADRLWLKKDNHGVSPLSLAASELNFGVLDYTVNQSELSAEEVVKAQDSVVLELLKCCLQPRLDEMSKSLKLSGKANDPFQVKQRIRRMLVAAAENYPSLFKSTQVTELLKNHPNEFPADILYVCKQSDQMSLAAAERKRGVEAWNIDCKAFETQLKEDKGSPSELLQRVYQRIDNMETILPRRHTYLGKLSARNAEGLTLLQQKIVTADLPFFQDLCNPLRFFDHSVDYSNLDLMRTSGGIHLLILLAQQMKEKPEESVEILKLLLSKAPELADQVDNLIDNVPEPYKDRVRNILENRCQIAVEKDQSLKTEFYRQRVFRNHLNFLNTILPTLRGEQQLVQGEARLDRSPELLRKAEHLNQPKGKSLSGLIRSILNPRMIGTVLSSFFERIRATFTGIFQPQKAQKIEAAALRTLSEVPHQIAKNIFGDRLISVSKNIGSKNVIDNEEDQKAAEQLYNEFTAKNKAIHKQLGIDKINDNEMKWGFLASAPDSWKGVIRSGDCWGTVMDLIQKYHENGFDSLRENAARYTDGVPASACANQALYLALNTFPDHPSDLIFAHLELLGRLDGMESITKQGIFNADFAVVQKLFAEIMLKEINFSKNPNLYRNKEADRKKLTDQIQRMRPSNPILAMISDRFKTSNRLMYDDGSNSVTKFFDQLREDWEAYVNANTTMPSQWAVGLNTLSWLEGLLMEQVGCRKMLARELTGMSIAERQRQEALGRTIDPRFAEIPDSRLKAFLAQVDATQQLHRSESAVIKMRGMKQEAIHELPERHVAPTDTDYLRLFKQLKDGAYVISFSTKSFQADGAHSIAYFKHGEESYLFDPNLGLIHCLPNKHAEDLLELLSIYPMPSGKQSHEMEIRSVSLR